MFSLNINQIIYKRNFWDIPPLSMSVQSIQKFQHHIILPIFPIKQEEMQQPTYLISAVFCEPTPDKILELRGLLFPQEYFTFPLGTL